MYVIDVIILDLLIDLLMISMNLSDIYISNFKNTDYRCIIKKRNIAILKL